MMNTNFVLMLATMLSTPFHFKDRVVVTKGFYEGCKGTVEHQIQVDPPVYDVDLDCKGSIVPESFKGDELKKCTK